ncbi:hypothetical protein [Actinokineospora sp. NBRC 105648]|uniref:hypothetical protein n=1 Tax=Actinokineospora sp. NBRC 105648 TaxID=3032206 RepID=UPI0024A2071A|nr:hypothetical protein [Actinokineospora sp. NBRC 105648]GLZ42582.1 hypothetical protein Acsp05_62060 [Actinokineospora sp. NBRC 105648]
MTTPASPGSISVGVKNDLQGVYTGTIKFTLTDIKLGDVPDRIGQLSVFGGDIELKYPFGVGPLQAAVTMNYLHWKLPELGPVLGEVLLKGAANVATNNNWGTTQGIELRLRETHVRNLEVRVGLDFQIQNKDNVQTQGWVTSFGATYRF